MASGKSGDDKNSEPIGWKHVLTQLFRRDIVKPPATFCLGADIEKHLEELDAYMELALITESRDRCMVLKNTLSEEVWMEFCMTAGFNAHASDYVWQKDHLISQYKTKQSRASPLTALLEMSQTSLQPTEEYLRLLRIHAFRHINHLNDETQRRYLLHAFLHGLRNRKVAKAVELLQPATVEEAYDIVKREDKQHSSHHVHAVHVESDSVNAVGQKPPVSSLVQLVNSLQSKIIALERDMQFIKRQVGERKMYPTNPNINRPFQSPQRGPRRGLAPRISPSVNVTCYNCGERGHVSSYCSKPTKCYGCGGSNHISRNCPQRRQNMNTVNGLSYADVASLSLSNRFNDLEVEGSTVEGPVEGPNEQEAAYMVIKDNRPQRMSNGPGSRKPRFFGQPDTLCNEYANYIEGKVPKPVRGLSKMHTNHKSVIEMRIDSSRAKTLLDTGASCNLISKKFVERIGGFEMLPPKGSIRCANASPMRMVGRVHVRVHLGRGSEVMDFAVVEDMPDVDAILGIRSMRRLGVDLDLKRSGALVDGLFIPFIGEIVSSTTVAGNGGALSL